jgi:hypothetical protein
MKLKLLKFLMQQVTAQIYTQVFMLHHN